MDWWKLQEYAYEIGDIQAPADMRDTNVGDVLGDNEAISSMQIAPIGEPPQDYDVVAVYDSRPVNGYDFNISLHASNVVSSANVTFSATFVCPNGYRMVPREWDIHYDNPAPGSAINSTVTIQSNGANLPYNGPIVIGSGTQSPIKTFFVVEENNTFGITGINTNFSTGGTSSAVVINVHGNLIPVTDVPLPFTVTNRKNL